MMTNKDRDKEKLKRKFNPPDGTMKCITCAFYRPWSGYFSVGKCMRLDKLIEYAQFEGCIHFKA